VISTDTNNSISGNHFHIIGVEAFSVVDKNGRSQRQTELQCGAKRSKLVTAGRSIEIMSDRTLKTMTVEVEYALVVPFTSKLLSFVLSAASLLEVPRELYWSWNTTLKDYWSTGVPISHPTTHYY
jgi:hypothetical protein